MNSNIKTVAFWVVLACVIALLIVVVKSGQGPKEQTLSFTEFQDKVKSKEVRSVVITGNEVHGLFQNPTLGLHTYIPANYPDIYNLLRDNNVDMTIKDNSSGTWISMLINFSPFIVLFAFWIFMMRQMQNRRPPPAAV